MADGMADLFYSYSHRDEELRDQLDVHLALLKRRGVLRTWHDRRISAGAEWKNEIDSEIERADVVLLLISADFLASDYCYDVEMKRALDRHAAKEARVIPVIVRACDGLDDAPFAHLQALPKDRKPVTSWPNRDEAWVDVARGIRLSVKELPARPVIVSPPTPTPTPTPASPPRSDGGGEARTGSARGWGTPESGDPVASADDGFGRPRQEPQPATFGEGRGSLVMRILRKLGGGVAKGVVVGSPDADADSHESPPPPFSSPSRPRPSPPRTAPAKPGAPDPARERRESELMQRVITEFSDRVRAAHDGRNAGAQFAPEAAAAAGEALVGIREQKRILWVDDAPAGNAQEMNALLGLQFDVQQVTSTQGALDALAAADPQFDLVISDWNRVPRVDLLTPEGVRLLRLMRRAGFTMPLIYYHSEFDEKRARGRASHARREGAFGATSVPGELFKLVPAALGDRGSPAA